MQPTEKTDISVLIPVFNEEKNIRRCLEALKNWAEEIIVVDSQSTDSTIEIAESFGAKVLQFHYKGGWPKKRQWALDTYDFRNDWILLLDADEIVTQELKLEVEKSLNISYLNGFYIRLELVFLGRRLKHGGFDFYKLNLFRKGKGTFEKRIDNQTMEMSDIEVHEHVKIQGTTEYLKHAIEHHNVNNIFRYIQKHNEYSTWEAEIMHKTKHGLLGRNEIPPKLIGGSQTQKRRWFKNKLFFLPGFSIITFLYHYILRLGFLDGIPGLIYCGFKGIQRFHAKAKLKELQIELSSQYND